MNAAETHRFDGSIPEMYDRALGPLLFEPYARDLAGRIPTGTSGRWLEIAAGTGRVTRHLRGRLRKDATLVATDAAEAMIEKGRSLLHEDDQLSWRVADATALPFPDRSFDGIVCQFGLMFFPDKPAAAREMRRVLDTGGRVLLNVWDRIEANPMFLLTDGLVSSRFASDPPPFYKIPFSYPDPLVLRQLFVDAGFEDVSVHTVSITGESPSAAEAASGVIRGNPIVNDLKERGVGDVTEIEAAVATALAEQFGDHPLRVPLRAHVLEAQVKG